MKITGTDERKASEKEHRKRKQNRLSEFDYSIANAYFVTLCIKNRQNLLWAAGGICGLRREIPPLSAIGAMVEKEIRNISSHYENVTIDHFCIMPDHIHMIVLIGIREEQNRGRPQVAPTLSRIIQQFKGSITKKTGLSIWQKSFYDHIIRDEKDYRNIWDYIETNPSRAEA